MNKAILLTGSNMGDREVQLSKAKNLIEIYCGVVKEVSHLYETAAWGNTEQGKFLNQALEIETNLNARQLIRKILKTEKLMGRVRKEKYGPRLIDIDIIFFNEEKHAYSFLTLPHPEVQNRRFALEPLAEIAPGYIHPVLHKSIKQLLTDCTDPLPVRRYD